MPTRDFVVRDLKFEREGIINVKEFYSLLKKWVMDHNYDFTEKEYIDSLKDETEFVKNTKIKWVNERKVDDYIKFFIEVTIKFKNFKEVKDKKDRHTYKGTVNVEIEAYLEKDYEEVWEKNFMLHFMREIYDKTVDSNKFNKYKKELNEEVYDLINDIKAFLKLEE
ncbi:MAG: hypothetical protein PHE43_02390 [Candidatus Nanoarchaeia archaeon]|nr:hypothetical protein [Candidatus Nanoarchaeia archaeon]